MIALFFFAGGILTLFLLVALKHRNLFDIKLLPRDHDAFPCAARGAFFVVFEIFVDRAALFAADGGDEQLDHGTDLAHGGAALGGEEGEQRLGLGGEQPVEQRGDLLAFAVSELVMDRIEGAPAGGLRLLPPGPLVVRTSTAAR